MCSLITEAEPGRGEAQKHSEAFYRVKVRFSANEHAKMYCKKENDKKTKKKVSFVKKKNVFVGF